jgi:HSP20 family protein
MVEARKTVPVTTESKGQTPAPAATRARSPVASLRGEIDRLFDEFSFPFGGSLFEPSRLWRSRLHTADLSPEADIVEKDKEFQLTVELAGIDPGNVAVSVADNVLTVKGEKKEEKVESRKGYHLSERRYGMFERSFDLPASVDQAGIDASFAKGVLSIRLPKTTEAQKQARQIEVRTH